MFADPCKDRKRKLNYARIVQHYACEKTIQDRDPVFAVKFLCSSSFKKLQYCFRTIKPPKLLVFALYENVPKMPKDIKKYVNKGFM